MRTFLAHVVRALNNTRLCTNVPVRIQGVIRWSEIAYTGGLRHLLLYHPKPCGQSGSPPWVHRLQWQSCHAGCDAGVPLACAGISAATVMAALRAARAAHGEVLGAMEGAVAAAGPPEPRFGQVAIEPAQIGRFIGAGAASLQSQPW